MSKETFFLIIFLFPNIPLYAQPNYLIKRDISDKKAIFFKKISSNEIKIIYKSNKDLVQDVKISSNNIFIAFLETTLGIVESQKYKIPPANNLRIIDSSGATIQYITEDVREFVWSPDGYQVAYITGTYSQGSAFISQGLYILNVRTGENKTVKNGLYPNELYWLNSNEEDVLYLKILSESRILKYNLNTANIDTTNFKSLHFSADGQYYFMLPVESIAEGLCDFPKESCCHLYVTKTNKLLPEYLNKSYGHPIGWMFGQGHYFLFFQEKEETSTVYNIETGKVILQFKGKPNTGRKWGDWVSTENFIVLNDKVITFPSEDIHE